MKANTSWPLLLLVFATSASGSPVTFTFTATGSGTIGASTFTNALATVTGVGDTSAIFAPPFPQYPPNILFIDPSQLSISISGVGMAAFTGTGLLGGHGYFFDNQNYQSYYSNLSQPVAGFGTDSDRGYVVGPFAATYTLSTSIGPVADLGMFFSNDSTSLGLLTFTTTANGTFTAVVGSAVPEPSSLFVLLGGLGWIVSDGFMRRYQRSRKM